MVVLCKVSIHAVGGDAKKVAVYANVNNFSEILAVFT